MAPLLRLALLVTALTFAFFATQAFAEDDYDGPEMGQSMDPDDLTVESEDVDDLEGDSEDPDDLVVESEDPDDMMGHSENPDDMVVESEDLEDHAGRSYELDDLPQDARQREPPGPDAAAGCQALAAEPQRWLRRSTPPGARSRPPSETWRRRTTSTPT